MFNRHSSCLHRKLFLHVQFRNTESLQQNKQFTGVFNTRAWASTTLHNTIRFLSAQTSVNAVTRSEKTGEAPAIRALKSLAAQPQPAGKRDTPAHSGRSPAPTPGPPTFTFSDFISVSVYRPFMKPVVRITFNRESEAPVSARQDSLALSPSRCARAPGLTGADQPGLLAPRTEFRLSLDGRGSPTCQPLHQAEASLAEGTGDITGTCRVARGQGRHPPALRSGRGVREPRPVAVRSEGRSEGRRRQAQRRGAGGGAGEARWAPGQEGSVPEAEGLRGARSSLGPESGGA